MQHGLRPQSRPLVRSARFRSCFSSDLTGKKSSLTGGIPPTSQSSHHRGRPISLPSTLMKTMMQKAKSGALSGALQSSFGASLHNPFFGSTTDKQEIFPYGLRNPFRASFDPQTGRMFIGDVREMDREKIDINPRSNPGGAKISAGDVGRVSFRTLSTTIIFHHLTLLIPSLTMPMPTPGSASLAAMSIAEEECLTCVASMSSPTASARKTEILPAGFSLSSTTTAWLRIFRTLPSQLFPTRIGGYTLTGVTSLGQDALGEIYITTLGGDVFQIRGGRGGRD